jgi:sugar/nucleoside kinase (ribokinase family)
MAYSSDTRYDYVAVGHVTRDVIEDRTGGTVSQPGGGAFYSALQASRLGLRSLIVTQGAQREIETLLEPYRDELELKVIAAQHTTTLSTRGFGEDRAQRILSWAGPIVEPLELNTAILHLAPVARETPVVWQGEASFVGVTPQGLVRHWEQALPAGISPVELDPKSLPEHFDAAVISEQERPCCRALFTAAHRFGAYVAVTAGSRPATVHLPGSGDESAVQTSLPPPVALRDDLGAGDVFAAAFFIALANDQGPLKAATFANAAAAVRISGEGPDAVGGREAIAP